MTEKIVTIDGTPHELDVERDGSSFTAAGEAVELLEVHGGEAVIRVAGRRHVVPFVVEGTIVSFAWDGEVYSADVADKGVRSRARHHRDQSTAAPMPGVVLKLLVAEGATVARGDALLILEAMKMEHTIAAPFDGRVVAIRCREGELVQPGVELVELEK